MPIPPSKLQPTTLEPYWSTTDSDTVRLYHGHVLDVLKRMPAKSVQCCVTSPPYWGLRDYGTGTWEGRSAGCDHISHTAEIRHKTSTLGPSAEQRALGTGREHSASNAAFQSKVSQYKNTCGKCGAKRIDQQLGSEKLHDCGQLLSVGDGLFRRVNCAELDWASGCHVCRMVLIFREVRRVLRDDGTCWLNYGDSYGGGGGPPSNKSKLNGGRGVGPTEKLSQLSSFNTHHNLPSGNLVGIPWRVALALQADGWVLRQDIIWAKPAPMPESVRNRCTKAHEYIFLLTKSSKYYYDVEAIKEKSSLSSGGYQSRWKNGENMRSESSKSRGSEEHGQMLDDVVKFSEMSNRRSVWTISSQGYAGAHFAVFPEKLIIPCIKAGTSEKGACAKCGTPWKRKVESERYPTRPGLETKIERKLTETQGSIASSTLGSIIGNRDMRRHCSSSKTVGWEPGCSCNAGVRPCITLDCFVGSGTTCAVSLQLGRWSWGIDLSEVYLKRNAIPRIEGKIRSMNLLELLHREPGKPVQLNGVKFSG